MNQLEDTYDSLSSISSSLDTDSKKTQSSLQESTSAFQSYASANTENLLCLQQSLQDTQQSLSRHQQSSTSVLEALTDRVKSIPTSDNMRAFERQSHDLSIQRAKFTAALNKQNKIIHGTLTCKQSADSLFAQINTDLIHLESKSEGLETLF